jgi:hypothetical protein
MPGPIRRPLVHHAASVIITDEAVSIFERGLRLRRKQDWSDAIARNGFELAAALRLKPWDDCPLDPSGDDQSRRLRAQLQSTLRERRKARRNGGMSDQPPA